MYFVHVTEHVDKIFEKLSKRDKTQLKAIQKKILQILENPYKFKPLRAPLQNKRRVHIDKSFVLLFSIDEKNKKVIVENYDHHDDIYKR
jgi:YafQ family addiction module toxin component